VSINLNFYPFTIVSNNFHSYLITAATELHICNRQKNNVYKMVSRMKNNGNVSKWCDSAKKIVFFFVLFAMLIS
jgi:hypothetical protein